LDPCRIEVGDYPEGDSTSERVVFLLRYAVLAPSSHNTQPWRFRVDADGVELRADRTRRLPVVDPHDGELVISCGAALETLRLAARRSGDEFHVDPLPDPSDRDLLARLRLETGKPANATDNALFSAQ
jgi:hypothetical protein